MDLAAKPWWSSQYLESGLVGSVAECFRKCRGQICYLVNYQVINPTVCGFWGFVNMYRVREIALRPFVEKGSHKWKMIQQKSCGKLEVVLLAETGKRVGQQRFVCTELHLNGIKQGLSHLLEGFPTKLESFL